MPHAYTEDQYAAHPHPAPPSGRGGEQPAIGLFAELGWLVTGPSPMVGVAGEPCDAGLLGRETKGEVVLVPRLRVALEKLNASRMGLHVPPDLPSRWLQFFDRFHPQVKNPVSVKITPK